MLSRHHGLCQALRTGPLRYSWDGRAYALGEDTAPRWLESRCVATRATDGVESALRWALLNDTAFDRKRVLKKGVQAALEAVPRACCDVRTMLAAEWYRLKGWGYGAETSMMQTAGKAQSAHIPSVPRR